MRRLALIFGMFLTLSAGVWSSASAAAFASCMHDASAMPAPDEHDCCRAQIGEPDAPHAAPGETSHGEAAHENSSTDNQAQESHAGTDCAGAAASTARETGVVAMSERGLSCAECCVGGSGQTPATAAVVAPEQNKIKRDAGSASARERDAFPPASSPVSHLAPSQHAPPAHPERRHVLIGVFLI